MVYGAGVTNGYQIKDAAERSGFSPATLRYYEEIGLLPEPSRTPAGYRVYDDHTLDRLAFIARAKQLGCTLEEVAALTVAWDGGQCGPVQDRLRAVVADKLAAAQQQIAALMTLTADLQHAAATLELHRPEGPCDDQCGCVSEPPESERSASPHMVSLTTKPTTADDGTPIACTLDPDSMPGRRDEWQALLTHVTGLDSIDGGVRAALGPQSPLADLLRLAVAEQDCCRFFEFAITVDDRGVALEVRSPADALPIVHSLFGVPT